MEARQQAGLRQPLKVAPHRLYRDIQMGGQFIHGAGTAFANMLQELKLACVRIHAFYCKYDKREFTSKEKESILGFSSREFLYKTNHNAQNRTKSQRHTTHLRLTSIGKTVGHDKRR